MEQKKLLVFPMENHTFRDPKGSQVEAYVEVYVGAKLELVLGSMLDRFWEVTGSAGRADRFCTPSSLTRGVQGGKARGWEPMRGRRKGVGSAQEN